MRFFVAPNAAANGIDVFRVFDSLNWVENMRVAIDAVLETGAAVRGAICYTGDLDPMRGEKKYDARLLHQSMARELKAAWRARAGYQGHGRPPAGRLARPRQLVKALKEEVGLPVHFHTHDTSGISAAASVLAAAAAGC